MNPSGKTYKDYLSSPDIIRFGVKALIVWLTLSLVMLQIHVVLQRFSQQIKSPDDDNTTRLYLRGLVTNPEAFYMAAVLYEKRGENDKAVTDLELALELLRARHADKDEIERYQTLLQANKIKWSQRKNSTRIMD